MFHSLVAEFTYDAKWSNMSYFLGATSFSWKRFCWMSFYEINLHETPISYDGLFLKVHFSRIAFLKTAPFPEHWTILPFALTDETLHNVDAARWAL